MATIFPPSPVGSLPSEVLKTFHTLKSMPEGYFIWHHLAPWTPQSPDFLIRTPTNKAILLKVSPASTQEARPATQMLLLETEEVELGKTEENILENFIADLDVSISAKIQNVVIFPNIKRKKLKQSRPLSSNSSIHWFGNEFFQQNIAVFGKKTSQQSPLSESQWEKIRQKFTPEVVVPLNLTTRNAPPRRLKAKLTEFLLDYDQEEALKTDLALLDSGEKLAQNFRLNLVNGVTGSGKTLILLYRLRLLNELYPGKTFLVLTHNRALIRDLESRYFRLTGQEPKNIQWYTFNRWCRAHWPSSETWSELISENERNAIFREIKAKVFPESHMTIGMLRSEVAWLKDNGITNREMYLEANRRGRGFGLTQEQRSQVFTATLQYHKELRPRMDWHDVPLKMWKFIRRGQVKLKHYDVVLLDEAQFFAPVWFDIVKMLVKSNTGHLFLAADPTQGFLRQGISWKSLGLEVRGRSYHLNRSYRTTRPILNFATRFYQIRVPDDAEKTDILIPDFRNMPRGRKPQIISLSSSQDEVQRIANETTALVQKGTQKEDILILHTDAIAAKQMIDTIDRNLGRGAALDPKDSHPGNYIRVTTVNAGTGLEAPIVFLAGLNRSFEEENGLHLSDHDRTEMILNNTRKIYMAATRAGQRLVVSVVGKTPMIFARLTDEGFSEITD